MNTHGEVANHNVQHCYAPAYGCAFTHLQQVQMMPKGMYVTSPSCPGEAEHLRSDGAKDSLKPHFLRLHYLNRVTIHLEIRLPVDTSALGRIGTLLLCRSVWLCRSRAYQMV
jgi:hypothetical protein